MTDAIQIRENRWLHRADLERHPFGRTDPAELIDECWEELEAQSAAPQDNVRPLKATGKLVAGRVRAAAGMHASSDTELRRVVEQQQEIIQQQQGAINRLLAFVPTRTRTLEDARLAEIFAIVSQTTSELFEGHKQSIAIAPETDDDTPACHRFLVDVVFMAEFDPADFVGRVVELNRRVAEALSVEEFQALRIFVEPEFTSPGESD